MMGSFHNRLNSYPSFSLGRRCRKAADEGKYMMHNEATRMMINKLPSPALRAPSPQGEGGLKVMSYA